MENSEDRNVNILAHEADGEIATQMPQEDSKNKTERLKKPIIFGLMGVVFVCCMYLLFKPANKEKDLEIGLNDAVPQATNAGIESDKRKSYEKALFEQKEQEKKEALISLSDYFQHDSLKESPSSLSVEEDEDQNIYSRTAKGNSISAVDSYRNAQGALGGFYQDNSSETIELRKQLDELKEKLAEREDSPAGNFTMDDQLTLMEKSYQMAAKYLPSGNGGSTGMASLVNQSSRSNDSVKINNVPKEHLVAFEPARKNVVSALYRELSDSAFVVNVSGERNRGFYTAGVLEQAVQSRNSVRAVVLETQTISGESEVRLRMLEAAQLQKITIPAGTELLAKTKFQSGRLLLRVNSIELDGSIIPVDISIYDLDGQQGLLVPYSPEMNALTEMAGNMSQSAGTNLMMTSSAKQQVAADLSRGVIQGISGYFAKKVRTPKVTIKSGHQVFLVSKK